MDPVLQRCHGHYICHCLLLVQHGTSRRPQSKQATRILRSLQEYMEQQVCVCVCVHRGMGVQFCVSVYVYFNITWDQIYNTI